MPANGATAIQSVQRAARILGLFKVARPRLTLSEMTRLAGLSKPTVHRYTTALREAELLRYDRLAGAYTLGPQVLRLGAAARAGLPILAVAGSAMQRLMQELNQTVVLSVWDGQAPVVVHVEENVERVVRVSVAVGARLSMTDSAQGRVFCAFLPEGDVPGLRAKLRSLPDLQRVLDEVRNTGLALNSPSAYGVNAIAAPVFGDGEIVASIALVGTVMSIPAERESAMALRLSEYAKELSAQLGG